MKSTKVLLIAGAVVVLLIVGLLVFRRVGKRALLPAKSALQTEEQMLDQVSPDDFNADDLKETAADSGADGSGLDRELDALEKELNSLDPNNFSASDLR